MENSPLKILLIYPYFLDDRIRSDDVQTIPIGLYYVGAMLRESGYDVEILNWHDINKRPLEIERILREKHPDVIGFSIVHANRWGGIDIARVAKKIFPGVKIVFGGIGATFLCEHFLSNFSEIDFIVLGEGEYSFLNLVRSIENQNYNAVDNIKGIAYRRESTIVKTAPTEFVRNLDELPMPSKYFEFQHLVSSRGCPSDCTFCGSPRFWGRRVRFHSPEYFVDQIEQLYRKGISFFYFSDDTFTMREDRVIEICKNILERQMKITWFAISRVDYVSENMLFWMRKAGCIQISYGVESGSERIRRVMNKNIRTDDVERVFVLTPRYGILSRAYFIYGSPGETWETIQETLDLINKIRPLSVVFYILDIFPGTVLYQDFLQRTGNSDDFWLKRVEDIMFFETDEQLSKDIILAFGEKLRSEYYENLPGFADAIELIDRQEFYESHADFLSRLAMTFSHGEYSAIEAIPHKDELAERLYSGALSYFPDHRAYLGLGILKQKQRRYAESIAILSEGFSYFPESEQLAVCLGISHMNLSQFEKALQYLQKFSHSEDVLKYIHACHKALGHHEKGPPR